MLSIQNILYVIAALLFIVGIKGLTHPRTAVRGNLISLCGMLLAMVTAAALNPDLYQGWIWWVIGGLIGLIIGLTAARMVQMTMMPEMVALSTNSIPPCSQSARVVWVQVWTTEAPSARVSLDLDSTLATDMNVSEAACAVVERIPPMSANPPAANTKMIVSRNNGLRIIILLHFLVSRNAITVTCASLSCTLMVLTTGYLPSGRQSTSPGLKPHQASNHQDNSGDRHSHGICHTFLRQCPVYYQARNAHR